MSADRRGRTDTPVLVIGAGPTGLVTALLLTALGVPTVVVDRHDGVHPAPRAVHLDDEAVRILARAGVGDAFTAISRPAAGLRLVDANLCTFAEFRRDSAEGVHGHPASNLFDQPDLERLLRAELARRPLATLRGGLEATSVEENRVTLRHVTGGATEEIRARFVLACDGAGSTVRDAIGARWRDLHFDQRWFVIDVLSPDPIPSWGGIDQVCDPSRAATFMHLAGDRYRWEFRMLAGETAADLTARIGALTNRWRGDPAARLDVLRAAEYTFRARIADRWRDGRTLLLGDAAHLTPPFVGQGLGAGLRDAHNLAWKVAALLRDRPPAAAQAALLDSYQLERAPHAEAMIRAAVRIGRAMTGGQDIAAAVRRPLAGLLLRVPAVRARAVRGTVTRYPPGPDVDGRRHRHDLAGTLCPQPHVHLGGRRVRLDDAIGDGYSLLHHGPVPAALAARALALGARRVPLDPADTELATWMRRGRATAVLLRPDRVVVATAHRREVT